jgi:transcriptional regulator with XRE-family HTH domain
VPIIRRAKVYRHVFAFHIARFGQALPECQVPRSAINPTDMHVGARVRMRRLTLDMSQSDIANALGLTIQQVQKYEKGSNRISASRLQHISQILQVPVPFFFQGAPPAPGLRPPTDDVPSPAYVSDFLATSDGLSLVKAFMCIEDPKLRRASGSSRRSRRRRRELNFVCDLDHIHECRAEIDWTSILLFDWSLRLRRGGLFFPVGIITLSCHDDWRMAAPAGKPPAVLRRQHRNEGRRCAWSDRGLCSA